jgi:predicted Zn-dependent protease
MAYDAYSPCPGGTGKKIKFCCPELLGELEKIERMKSGQQYQACLEHVDRLDKKHPGRACLLTAKAEMLLQLDRAAEADEAAQSLVTLQPENPIALAYAAQAAIEASGTAAAVALLQRALAAVSETIHQAVLSSVAFVGQALLMEGRIAAGRRHIALVLDYIPREETMQRLLAQVDQSEVHPLFKLQWTVAPPPDDSVWKAEFQAARLDIARGIWQRAATQLTSLLERFPEQPLLWQALAAARVGLADDLATAEALHRYAQLAPDEADAVHAEAVAQLFEETERGDWVEAILVTRPVHDIEQVLARLTANPRSLGMQVPSRESEEDDPPPKAAYALLDRAAEELGDDIQVDQVPRILGQVFVFGRQTDREARLEVATRKGPQRDAAHQFLEEALGEHIGPADGEELLDRRPALGDTLRKEWLLPAGLSADRQQAIGREDRRQALLERVPQLHCQVFGGRTVAEAAADAALRLPVLGWLLKAELSLNVPTAAEELDALREKLGLPVPPRLAFEAHHVVTRLGWLPRLDVERTADDPLRFGLFEAMRTGISSALERLVPAALARPLQNIPSSDVLYMVLAENQEDSARALEQLDRARQAAVAAGQSPANFDLAVVRMRLERREFEPALALLQRVARDHPREPGVGQQIAAIMAALGYGPGSQPRAGAAPLEPVGAAAADEPGKIWTPEGERGEAKSGLWLPGQD